MPAPYECVLCLNLYQSSLDFINHIYDYHATVEKTCCSCKKDRNITEYDMIFGDICSNCKDKLQCPKCENTFSRQYLVEHQKKCHGPRDLTKRKCKQCLNVKQLSAFYTTFSTCKECLSRKVLCEKCGKTFTFRYINHHNQAYHS